MQVRKAIIFHSLDILNKNTDSQAKVAQTAARKVTASSQGHSLLSDQYLRPCASCEEIEKKEFRSL